MSDWPWVIASYALTWIVLGGYALMILGKLDKAKAELDAERRPSKEMEQ